MERVLTQEERIKRAEEIYLRRRARVEPKLTYRRGNTENPEKKINNSVKFLKRIALQIIICLLLYCIFYLIYDTNYSFSEITISKINEILNYDVNFDFIYKNVNEFIVSIFNKDMETEKETNDKEEIEIQDENIETEKSNETGQISENVENIESLEKTNDETITENIQEVEKKQEENLKDKYSLIVPVNGGYISSRFGAREATSELMSTNHKGLDIAVSKRNEYLFFNGRKGCCFNYI